MGTPFCCFFCWAEAFQFDIVPLDFCFSCLYSALFRIQTHPKYYARYFTYAKFSLDNFFEVDVLASNLQMEEMNLR